MHRIPTVALALALIASTVAAVAGCSERHGASSVVVGAARNPESALIAHLYAAALRFYGSPARVETTDDPLGALDSADVRVVVGFTGQLLTRLAPDAAARAPAQVYRALVSALPEGVAAGDYTPSAEDKPAVTVTEQIARAWGGRDVTAMVRNCVTVAIGEAQEAIRPPVVGTCTLSNPRQYVGDTALFVAVRAGQVNAAWTTTATPGVPAELLTLSDRTSLIRAENLVPLYRRNELTEQQVLAVNEVAGVLDTAALVAMRAAMAAGAQPQAVADAFVAEHPLGR